MHATGSRNRLTPHQLGLYPGTSLFHRIARTVCGVGVLPRKELHEAWEVARRVRRRFHGGRVVDLCCGHGLLAHVMLLLDAAADAGQVALAVDTRLPPSQAKLHAAMVDTWPKLRDRIEFVSGRLQDVTLSPDDIVVSTHACGSLTDDVLAQAVRAGARVAVLPCCHALRTRGELEGWLDGALAMDVERATSLRAAGYAVWTHTIPEEVTPKNRVLLGERRRRAG